VRADPVSEESYHEGECKGNWEDIGISRRGIGWAISSDVSLTAFLVVCRNRKNIQGREKVGNTYRGGCLAQHGDPLLYSFLCRLASSDYNRGVEVRERSYLRSSSLNNQGQREMAPFELGAGLGGGGRPVIFRDRNMDDFISQGMTESIKQ